MPDELNESQKARKAVEWYAVWAVFGSALTGLAGIIGFLLLFAMDPNQPGPALCLVASALAFGLLANAMLRS